MSRAQNTSVIRNYFGRHNHLAAKLHAAADKSDPFAYGRMKHRLDSGQEDKVTKSEGVIRGHLLVSKEAIGILQARWNDVKNEYDARLKQFGMNGAISNDHPAVIEFART
jgi:hypothetical protein